MCAGGLFGKVGKGFLSGSTGLSFVQGVICAWMMAVVSSGAVQWKGQVI